MTDEQILTVWWSRNLITGLYDYYWGLDDIDCGIDTNTKREPLAAIKNRCLPSP